MKLRTTKIRNINEDDKVLSLSYKIKQEPKEIIAQALNQCNSTINTIDAVMSCLNELNILLNKYQMNKDNYDFKNRGNSK